MALTNKLSAIGDAIRAKTGKTDLIPLDQMPAEIESIKGGGGGGSTSGPLDPVEVYNNTRPSDWLPMPTPTENEMYLLFHIPDGVSSLLAFTVTCTGNYTVALGTMSGDSFVASSSVDIASGSKYEAELFADDYGDLTSDGNKQVMVKVSGTDILTWAPSTHSKKTAPSKFAGWNIIEISCNLPSGKNVACGNNVQSLALKKLQYFTWIGKNAVTTMSYMFGYCYSLTAVPQLDTSSVRVVSRMFRGCSALTSIPQLDTSAATNTCEMFGNCYSLTSIPQLDTSAATVTSYMFAYCYSLMAVPQLDTSAAIDMSSMFLNCSNLTAVPQMNTSSATSMSNMFLNCSNLTAVPQMNTSSATSMSNMFNGCNSLASIAFNGSVTGWAGYDVSLKDCSLGHTAIVAFFDSLPTITSAKAITLTGNPGVSELTAAEKAIATGKGWTLTL